MKSFLDRFSRFEDANVLQACVDLLDIATFLENTLVRLHPTFGREYTSKEIEILKHLISNDTVKHSYFRIELHPTLNELAKNGI